MREYGKVTNAFWQTVVKPWRGDSDAITLALYLSTNPHATMIGLYHCPLIFISHETGMSQEGASKALRRVSESHFCTYDDDKELVWVHEMAAIEIAPALKPKDNRVTAVAKLLAALPKCLITQAFFDRYAVPFCLLNRPELLEYSSVIEAPSKPLRSQLQVQGQLQGQEDHNSHIQERGIYKGTSVDEDSRAYVEWPEPDEVSR